MTIRKGNTQHNDTQCDNKKSNIQHDDKSV
jgi:hypothetical protein